MGFLTLTAGLLTVAAAVFVGIFYSVPEFEGTHTSPTHQPILALMIHARSTTASSSAADFRAPTFWGIPDKRDFQPIAEGLWKIDLPWHLTPFHEENLDLFLLKSQGGWCLR